jgi:Zn-dependent protease with chaperone function
VTAALGLAIAAAIALPHVLTLRRVPPATAVAIWMAALALRAAASMLVVVYVALYFPGTALFDALTHWCWHAIIPTLTSHFGLDGHVVGTAAILAPVALLAVSLLWMGMSAARGIRAARHLLARHSLGTGPRGSVIVGGPEVVLAVAGVTHPRIVVSAGALIALDDDELAAALDHEHAHIARRHRFVMIAALVLRALGRLVPGSGRALAETAFHLERDADRCALRRRDDPHTLARVITKSAVGAHPGSATSRRVHELLGDAPAGRRPAGIALNLVAAGLVAFAFALAAVVPPVALGGVEGGGHDDAHGSRCHHDLAHH